TGEKVQQLAHFIAATGGQHESGIRMEIDHGLATTIRMGGKPIGPNQTYKLATYDYLANGGDNSRGLDDPISRTNLGIKVREALIDYFFYKQKTAYDINTQLDGRIKSNQ